MRLEREAAESEIRSDILPKAIDFVSDASILGLTSKGLDKLLPFLNRALPISIAMKGIEKVLPKGKEFFDEVKNNNLPIEGAVDFIRDKVEDASKKEKTKKKGVEALGKFKEKINKRKVMEEERARFEDYYGQPQTQQPQEQVGSGEQDLMAILQQINARLNQ